MVVGLGGGGSQERLSPCPMAELDAVDDVGSFTLTVVSLGSPGVEELVFESIPVAAAPGKRYI